MNAEVQFDGGSDRRRIRARFGCGSNHLVCPDELVPTRTISAKDIGMRRKIMGVQVQFAQPIAPSIGAEEFSQLNSLLSSAVKKIASNRRLDLQEWSRMLAPIDREGTEWTGTENETWSKAFQDFMQGQKLVALATRSPTGTFKATKYMHDNIEKSGLRDFAVWTRDEPVHINTPLKVQPPTKKERPTYHGWAQYG